MNVIKIIRGFGQRVFSKHPIVLHATQTGLLVASGDMISQIFIEKHKLSKLDTERTFQFFIIGFGIIGPCSSTWFKFLAKNVGATGKTKEVLTKVALDQLIFAPVFLCVFITVYNTLRGMDLEFIKSELKKKYLRVLLANYSVWPFVQMVNFYAVPLHYQVLFVQCIALLWNTYLCWRTSQ